MTYLFLMGDKVIAATILYNLRRKKTIGGKHTHFDTLKRGFPGHLEKDVGKIAKVLIKKGWIISKPTSYGLQVTLNKEKIIEIEKFIFDTMSFSF